MDDIRVVCDLYQDGIKGYYANEYDVRPDSDIKRVEDLKGRVIASNGIGGAADMALRKMLRDHGLEDKRDYQLIEIEFPNMLTALTEKKIELGSFIMPFSYIGHQQGKLRTLFTVADSMGETQATLMAARVPFIAAHRPALVDFFEDTQIRRTAPRFSPSCRISPRSRNRISRPGSSSRARITTATSTRDPTSRRCRTTSTRNASSAFSISPST
jgi:hypothetical protein